MPERYQLLPAQGNAIRWDFGLCGARFDVYDHKNPHDCLGGIIGFAGTNSG